MQAHVQETMYGPTKFGNVTSESHSVVAVSEWSLQSNYRHYLAHQKTVECSPLAQAEERRQLQIMRQIRVCYVHVFVCRCVGFVFLVLGRR
jgi:hypothetical protein